MEKALRKELDDVRSQPGVTGILLSDDSGLCIVAEGCAAQSSSGLVTALATRAANLRMTTADDEAKTDSMSAEQPVIVLETDSSQVIFQLYLRDEHEHSHHIRITLIYCASNIKNVKTTHFLNCAIKIKTTCVLKCKKN